MSEYSLKQKRDFARTMREQPTEAERTLWLHLRRQQLGYRFHRQSLVAGYVIDFYCPARQLAIEVDGSVHAMLAEADRLRESHLRSAGITVLRFSNQDVLDRTSTVVCAIREGLKAVLYAVDITSSNSRGCASVDKYRKPQSVNDLAVQHETGNQVANPVQVVNIQTKFADLVATVSARSMDVFGIESWSSKTLANKKQSAKIALASWIAERQLKLDMPSSVKKAVETANEAINLTVGKGIELA